MATTKKRSKRTVEAPAEALPATGSVKVRMYRRMFGDCFLLTLPSAGQRPFYMMIDCGALPGSRNARETMQDIVRDVIETTGGHLDLLVVTHEHMDHISGFQQAKALFADGEGPEVPGKLHVHDLWFAWTENPQDELANRLRHHRHSTRRALRSMLQGLRAAEIHGDGTAADGGENGDWRVSEQVGSLMGFFGASGARGTAGALKAVRSYARRPPRYLVPGAAPVELAAAPGLRFYVLGPPREEALLKRSRPSKVRSEVYDAAFRLSPGGAFAAAALGASGEDGPFSEAQELSQPFDRTLRIPLTQAEQLPFFQQHYCGDAAEVEYRDQAWRRIDADWLGAAAELALKLDDDTNNTSLVLALELTATGQVLLFPGDAQVGSWLSWEELSWTLEGGRTVTAHDLLARTVLYKVGHHGSHNATLKEKGLELMSHEDLVAMVPVDQKVAAKKRWFKIPFKPLLDRLEEKTGGRVLRSDDQERVADKAPPTAASPRSWRRFQQRVEETDLYVEYSIDGNPAQAPGAQGGGTSAGRPCSA